MFDRKNFRLGWALLTGDEKKTAFWLLMLGVLNSIASVVMVGSIFPFLTVLVNPEIIQSNSLLKWVYEVFDFQSESEFSTAFAITTAVIIAVATLVQILNHYCIEKYCSRLVHNLGRRLLSLYLQQPYQYFLNAPSEKMSARILTEVEHVVDYYIRPIAQLWSAVLTCFAIAVLLAWTNPIIAGLALIILGGAYCLAFIFTQVTVQRLGRQRTDSNDARFLVTREALAGIKDIKLLGHEKNYLDAFSVRSKTMANITAKIRIIAAVPRFIIHALAMCGVIGLCLPYIGAETSSGENGVGAVLPVFGLFAFAAQRLIPNIQMIFASLTEIQFGAASVSSLHSDFQLPQAGDTHWTVAASALGLKQEIRLENLYFDYKGSERSGLVDINVTIKAGERIGIVGGTGAGKTTLVDIVLGLLTPDQGRIVVDETSITSKNLRAWQKSVGYVPQDIFLTNGSITDNIAFGVTKADIDKERVKRAARHAELDRFIETELPNGFETEVGERGVRLSGGQRQRVGVARAFYREADLIVFDEATSALDNVTEHAVMSSLTSLNRETTVLIVAHRLSTIRSCDRIIVMDKGRIADVGRYDDLLRTSAVMRKLDSFGQKGKGEPET